MLCGGWAADVRELHHDVIKGPLAGGLAVDAAVNLLRDAHPASTRCSKLCAGQREGAGGVIKELTPMEHIAYGDYVS